eukprot:m.597221 g.597221  ORF g.597221 m.597221 type:complete len:254 (+) comp22416_c0_seq8:1726-2487(+)
MRAWRVHRNMLSREFLGLRWSLCVVPLHWCLSNASREQLAHAPVRRLSSETDTDAAPADSRARRGSKGKVKAATSIGVTTAPFTRRRSITKLTDHDGSHESSTDDLLSARNSVNKTSKLSSPAASAPSASKKDTSSLQQRRNTGDPRSAMNQNSADRGRAATLSSGWRPKMADMCVVCDKQVYPMEKLSAENTIYHKACFRCGQCNKMLKLGTYAALEGTLFCKPCFKKLFKLNGNYSEGFGKKQHKMKWVGK